MLKAEVAGIGFPEKGTPASWNYLTLLANVVLKNWLVDYKSMGSNTDTERISRENLKIRNN